MTSDTRTPCWDHIPTCLNCNWDDWSDRDPVRDGPDFAAYLDQETSWPVRDWFDERYYVAWLCVECAESAELLQWFVGTVRARYPDAVFLINPGTPIESHYEPP